MFRGMVTAIIWPIRKPETVTVFPWYKPTLEINVTCHNAAKNRVENLKLPLGVTLFIKSSLSFKVFVNV